MSNKIPEFKKNTKLQEQLEQIDKDNQSTKNSPVGFVKKIPERSTTMSIRVRKIDTNRINKILEEVNLESMDRSFTRTDVLRALIFFGAEKMDAKKIIHNIKNSY